MGTHTTTLKETCKKCETPLTRYHMKNPFIDDFSDECSKCEPGEAMGFLNSWSRSAAKAEQDHDYESDQESKSSRYDNSEEE